MLRNIDLDEISDGKLYTAGDLAKVGCQDCEGCCDCCCQMGDTIILDPLDVWQLMQGRGKSFEQLLDESLDLHVQDGVILPNLKMAGEKEQCVYLNEKGRCSIHPFRPGICRLFPLGRFYENGSFRYFLQTKECSSPIWRQRRGSIATFCRNFISGAGMQNRIFTISSQND